MDVNPFADLIPKGGNQNVFADLIPAKPANFEERFAGDTPQRQPSITDAVTDIPKEVAGAYTSAAQHLTGNSVNDLPGYDPRTRAQLGPVEGLMRTGKQVLGIPELLAALPVGMARSVIGHLMSQGEHWVGTIIAPERAAKDDPQKMYETAKGDVDTAMSAAAPAKVAAVVPKVIAPTISELKTAASGKAGAPGGYEGTELSSLEVKPTAISDYASKTKVALDAAGLDENLAPITHKMLTRLETVPPNATVTGNNIKSVRQLLGNAAGEPGKEGLAAKRALNALDEHIPQIEAKDVISGDPKAAGAALDEANANYSAAKHAETIDNKTIRAELRAAASNSGHNVANTVRQRFADILNPERPDLQRGFKPEELAMMDQIVRGTKTQNALREAGNYLGGGGGMGRLHVSALGAAIGAVVGPAGAAIGAAAPTALGAILKKAGNRSTIKSAEALSEAIRSRAPLASSARKFQQAAAAVQANRTPQAIAGAVLAARNLSTNMRTAGFNIAPADLLSGLQSPSGGNAEEQQ